MAISNPPIEIHEGRLARHKKRDKGREPLANAALDRMIKAATTARKNVELAHDLALRIKADKSFMGSRAAVKFPEDTKALFTTNDKAITEGIDIGLREISRLSKAIAPTEPSDKILAGQIRERFGKGSPDERAKWIEDENVAAAVLTVPSFVSGASEAEVELYAMKRAQARHPDEVEALNAVRKALHDLKDVGGAQERYLGELVRGMATPHAETAARTRTAQEAVATAVAE